MSKAVKLWLCEAFDLSLLLNKPSKFLEMPFKQILPHSPSEYLGKSFILGSVGRRLSSLCSELILLSLIKSKSPPGHSKFTQVSALGCFRDMIQWLLTNPLGKETGAAAECGWRGVCTDNPGSQCWQHSEGKRGAINISTCTVQADTHELSEPHCTDTPGCWTYNTNAIK